jgi:signal transduction histidine kinase
MFRLSSLTIRSQLVLLALIVAIPAAAIILYSGIRSRNHEIREALAEARQLAARIASEQNSLAASAEQLAIALAQLPDVKDHNVAGIEALLRSILQLNAQHSNIFLVDLKGRVWAANFPKNPPFTVSDRRYFINALASGRLSSGEFILNRATNKPALTFGYPYKNGNGRIIGVICIGFNLEYYKRFLNASELASGKSYLLLDHKGVVLTRPVNPEELVGKAYYPNQFREMQEGPDENAFAAVALDGKKRFIAYRKLKLQYEATPYMYVRVGIPVDIVLARANRSLILTLSVFFSFLAVALYIASRVGKRSLVDRVALLQNASQRLADGDLEVRVSDLVIGGELGRLGQTFDNMARQLTLREHALFEQQSFCSNLIRNAAIATFVLDSTHRIMLWNRACEELTGLRESDMIGTEGQWKPFYAVKQPTVADVIIDAASGGAPDLSRSYARSALNPQAIKAEGWYKNLGGKDRYLLFEAAPIYNSGGVLIAAIETLQDVTESKRMEEQLLQTQKIEAVGQLAGGVAHDFNNILSAIMGYGHMTLRKMRPDDLLRGYVEQILQAGERATTLTQSLLSFSRKRIINPAPHDLNEIVRSFEKFLLRLIREDITITTTCADRDLSVLVDRGQLEQVLMNLVANARDAIRERGNIAIRTEHLAIDEHFIEAHGFGKKGTYAVLEVSDTGEGMDEPTRRRIFEPFFTTKEEGKGTGLGLSMVYGIVKQHNGFVGVASEPGKGTSCKVYLSLVQGSVAAEKERAGQDRMPRGSETILVAEDDAAVRTLAAAVLHDHGYTVIEAIDGADAVSKYEEERARIRLVILDGIMPRKNGKEALHEIRRIDPSVKALFMSGYSEDIISKQGLLEPGITLVAKPLIPATLLNKVREMLDA